MAAKGYEEDVHLRLYKPSKSQTRTPSEPEAPEPKLSKQQVAEFLQRNILKQQDNQRMIEFKSKLQKDKELDCMFRPKIN
jgi:hypothetical protein